MERLEYSADMGDIQIMRDLRRQGMTLIRLIPGRLSRYDKPERPIIVYAVKTPA